MRNIFNHYILLILICIFPICISAQKPIHIKGYILDIHNNAIEAAHIYTSDSTELTFSDHRGYFEIGMQVSNLNIKRLNISCVGFNSKVCDLQGRSSDSLIVIYMKPATEFLQEVDITQKPISNSGLKNIGLLSKDLLISPSGNSIETLIKTLPGVSSRNELSSQYTVRGGNFDENAVYINGTEIYRPLLMRNGQQEGLSVINPDLVEKVNFSSGGFNAKYGNKIASVLDISYKQPKEFEAGISASLMGASAYVGSRHNNFTQIHGVRFKKNTSLLKTLDDKGEYNPTFLDYQTHLNWSISDRSKISFIGQLGRNMYKFIPKSRKTYFGSYLNAKEFNVHFSGSEKDLFQNILASVSFAYKPVAHANIRFRTAITNTLEEEKYDITGQYRLSDIAIDGSKNSDYAIGTYHEHARNRLQALIADIEHSGDIQIKNSHIEWGIQYKNEYIKDHLREWKMQDSAGFSIPSSPDKVNVSSNIKARNNLSTNRFHAYILDRLTWQNTSGYWSFTIGSRFSFWDYNKEFLFSPRANLSFTPEKFSNLHLYASAGIYHQSPFYKEYRDTINNQGNITVWPNSEIMSPRSIQFTAGLDLDFHISTKPCRLSSEIYYKALDRIIPYEINNIKITYAGKNLGSGYTTGIDLKLYGEFIAEADSWISLSIMKSEERISNKWYSRPTEQKVNLSLLFQDYLPNNPKYRFLLNANIGSGFIVYSPNGNRESGHFRTPVYKRVDCGVSREIVKGKDKLMQKAFLSPFKSICLALDFFNIFNFKNVNSYYWISDIQNHQYAIPNYLTTFQINLKVSAYL